MDKIIVANHKNYMDIDSIINYLRDINNLVQNQNVVICPSNIYLPYFLKHEYKVGIQNVASNSDICTGEITSKQARSIGVNYAIVGHSERRIKLNEDNLNLNKKVIEVLCNDLNVILCVGETASERKRRKAKKIVEKQIIECLKNIKDLSKVIIAYEPVWAIGTNVVPTNDEIKEMANFIKTIVKKHFDYDDIKVLYGGSVNAKNIEEINQIDELSGFLIGKAGTDVKEFLYMIGVVMN